MKAKITEGGITESRRAARKAVFLRNTGGVVVTGTHHPCKMDNAGSNPVTSTKLNITSTLKTEEQALKPIARPVNVGREEPSDFL